MSLLSRSVIALATAAVAALSILPAQAQEAEQRIANAATPTVTLLDSFTGTASTGTGASAGSTPHAGLIKTSNGTYYGTTTLGGTNSQGTIFCMTTGGAVTTLYNFGTAVNFTYSFSLNGTTTTGTTVTPQQPYGALIQGTDGNFYGTTYTDATTGPGVTGGPWGSGDIFEFTPATAAVGVCPTTGTLTILHQFLGDTVLAPNTLGEGDGKHVEWALVEGTDGYLYGMAHGGSSNVNAAGNTFGTLFKIQKSGANYSTLRSFTGTDGNSPLGGLVESTTTAPDGTNYYYGMTELGGVNSFGNVFKISASGTYFYDLADFNYNKTTALAGPAEPYGTPVIAANGTTLYGVSYAGGIGTTGTSPSSNDGVFFSIVDNGTTATISNLYAFSAHSDSDKPQAGIVLGSDGNYYGLGSAAGGNSDGTIFSVTPAGVETVLYAFPGGTTAGSVPLDNLVESPSGDFYFTTSTGGSSNLGTVEKIATGLATPVSVALSSPTTAPGEPITITYSSAIAYGATMSRCFATSVTPSGGVDPNWTGTLTVSPTAKTVTVTPTSVGTYTYTLTCGGSNSSSNPTLTVSAPNGILTFSSVSHNFGQVNVGTAATAYGIAVTNTGTVAYPFALSFTPTSGFTGATNCPASIAAGAKCEVVFYFTPTATGPVSTTWSITTETGFGYSPAAGGTLTGSGTSAGGVSVTTGGHNFGILASGTRSATYGTELSNSTSSAVTLTLGSVSAPFTALTNCGATLAAGASCELEFYATGNSSTSATSQTYSISVNGGTIPLTAGGTTITGITLTGN